MQLQGEKDSGKNNENSIDVTLNNDTHFMFYFLILQKYSKAKFLSLLPSKFLTIMYIRLSYILFRKKIEFNPFLSMFKIAQKPVNWLAMQGSFLAFFDWNIVSNRHVFISCVFSCVFQTTFSSKWYLYHTYRFLISIKYLMSALVCTW